MDNLLTNKYFCIAVIIALLVVIYLYSRKNSCSTEGMQDVDLTPLAQELTETPWTNRNGGGMHKDVNNRFDKFADRYTKKKLKDEGYSYTDFLKRSDQSYEKYMEYDGYETMMPEKQRRLMGKKMQKNKGCQPCICPQDNIIVSEDSYSESESERPIRGRPVRGHADRRKERQRKASRKN